jgi:hypothetical protein
MTLRITALHGLVLSVALLLAAAASAQAPLPMPAQQMPAGRAQPVQNGRHIQPNESELRALGVHEQPTMQSPPMDATTREMLGQAPRGVRGAEEPPMPRSAPAFSPTTRQMLGE